ncbi:uncharacterized protein LOC143377075 [Andrena cerasifolii]|uniref:uncharacterized protein LOC143377075 n=1 Tax=Andrena cerasifolii TaxID=2819439 RepID=UPI004037DE5F
MALSCPVTATCSRCSRRHHSLLHPTGTEPPNGTDEALATPSASTDQPTAATINSVTSPTPTDGAPVLLATAIVGVRSSGGELLTIRALLDQGAQVSILSESVVQTLRFPRQPQVTNLVSALDSKLGASQSQVRMTLAPPSGTSRTSVAITAHVVSKVSNYFPEWTPNKQRRDFAGLDFADPDPSTRRPIDLIVGADYFGALLLPGLRRGTPSALIAQKTIFGWIVSGPTGRAPAAGAVHHVTAQPVAAENDIHALLQKFWEVEEATVPTTLAPDDARCEQHFVSTHSRRADGRYVVRLPLKSGHPVDVGESRSRATALLRSLDRRLTRDATLERSCHAFLAEYEALGHMEEVAVPQRADSSPRLLHLPHHAVVKRAPGADAMLHVVFNASSPTSNGTCLNDHMLVGPKLQRDILAVLLQWRLPRFALKADIEKMYRQILVHPSDSNLQCILWHRRPGGAPLTFRLRTVTYDTASAPYLAMRVLQQLATDEGGRYPRGRQILRTQFYVDDVLVGADEVSSALADRDELCTLLARGGFVLRKWAANHRSLLPDNTTSATSE